MISRLKHKAIQFKVVRMFNKIAEYLVSPSGINRIAIARREDGNYEWFHEVYMPPDPEYGWDGGWDVTYPGVSGIYDTRERAVADARREVAWLRHLEIVPKSVTPARPWWRRLWPF